MLERNKETEKPETPRSRGSGGRGEAGAAGGGVLGRGASPRRWVVEPVAPWGPRPAWRWRWHPVPVWREERGFVTVVVGSGGTGKSYLLVDLAIAALTGGTWLGMAVTRVRSVLYVDAELDADTMRERSWAVARGRGLDRPPGPSRWWHLPGARLRPRGLHYLTLPVSLATTTGQALVAGKARACRADLILFDSLTIGSAGVALADADGWNAVVSAMERWGRPVVCIDHTPKSGHGQVGSFMKNARVRGGLALERTAEGTITVEHSKPQFGGKLPDWRIRPVFDRAAGTVRFEPLGADGQPLRGTAGPAAPMGAKVRRWGKHEQLVLDAYAAHGPAVPMVVAEYLRPLLGERAEKVVWAATPKLEKAEAIVAVGKVAPASGKGRPAVRYAAVGQATTAQVALAQAEALLRGAGPGGQRPHPGGAGGENR